MTNKEHKPASDAELLEAVAQATRLISPEVKAILQRREQDAAAKHKSNK